MQQPDIQQERHWWAEGDTPVHTDSQITYLVDGRTTLLTLCHHFLKARHYIYLADWGLTATMALVRGSDHRAGPDGSPEQEALLANLRAIGLSEEAIQFWTGNELTVQAVLGNAVQRGVEVKVLIWKGSPLFAHTDTEKSHQDLLAVGVDCLLDDSSFGILHHPVESLHQKFAVVDGTHAFVGGIDLLIENGGLFDRWDIPEHPFPTPLRVNDQGQTPHSWHDVHSIIEGPAAADVELNFRQRWNSVVHSHHLHEKLLISEHPVPPAIETQNVLQIARTIPQHTYHFDPNAIQGIAQLYANAFNNIQHFVYLENQYLWLRSYTGIDISLLGEDSPEMEKNLNLLRAALERGATMTIILPDHPNVGRAFSDAGLHRLRTQVSNAVEEGRLHAFTLASSASMNDGIHYRPIYVHAKVAIVDDLWSTVGSANLNNRGMRDDTEMNVATLDHTLAHGLRLMLQGEHLGLVEMQDMFALSRLLGRQKQTQAEQEQGAAALRTLITTLGDPLVAAHMMYERAWENLQRYKAHQPLIGHLLPYLTAEEAVAQGLQFHEDSGWIEKP